MKNNVLALSKGSNGNNIWQPFSYTPFSLTFGWVHTNKKKMTVNTENQRS